MTTSQPIYEAEANLQVAKAMDAIDRFDAHILNFAKTLDKGYGEKTAKVYQALDLVKNIVSDIEQFSSQACVRDDTKFVKDIVNGIKSKSQYEQQIDKLNARLQRGVSLFEAERIANDKLRSNINRLVTLLMDKKEMDNVDKNTLKSLLEESTDLKFEKIVDRMMRNYEPKEKCDTKGDMPF